MKQFFFTILLFSITAIGQNLKVTAIPLPGIPITADRFIGIDGLGYSYTVTNNVLVKQNDQKSWQYKNIASGKITSVDILNPLQLVLFYKEFNTVILLDNQLNEIKRINFSETAPDLFPQTASLASQNRLWIFDLNTQKLGLYDITKQTFQPISVTFKETLVSYQSDYNYFQWIDAHRNWSFCDVYGKTLSLGTIAEFDDAQLLENQTLLFRKEGQLYFYDAKKESYYTINNIEKTYSSYLYKNQILSIFTTKGISNYKINLP